jgi:hypothetical protein
MSVFASRVVREIAMPGDPEARVTIRRLNPRQLERAALAQQERVFAQVRQFGGRQFLEDLQAIGGLEGARAQGSPLGLYDRLTLLEEGVVGWSYDRPVDRAALEDLVEEAAQGLADAILRLSRPDLYETEGEAEARRKNA